MKNQILPIVLLGALTIAIFFLVRSLKFKPDNWHTEIKGVASSSSPQATDLNGDGVKDLVIGAGGVEFVWTDQAVLAIDGKTGATLWKTGGRNQVVGSPVFRDINHDGVTDVLIGGRSEILYCLDGKSGELIWEYLPSDDSLDIYNDTTVLNFYNPQFIPDMTDDGEEEMLVAYGGFIKARPNEMNRPSGYLMIVDPTTGKELIRAAMPDGRETYMSPVLYDFDADGDPEIIFGSGGETINGHLYLISLSELKKGDLSESVVLADGGGKGFIAPVILADITEDDVPDIVVNAVNGRTLCFDGKSNKKLWEVSLGDGYEIYTSPGPGNFNGDKTTDFFASFSKGAWPNIEASVNLAIDGKDGKVFYQDTLGTFQYASPVIADITHDGYDDILFALNIPAEQMLGTSPIKYLENRLMVFDIRNKVPFVFDQPKLGTNLGSTPLLTDLDDDGNIDVIYCYSTDATNSYSFKGMAVERMELSLSPKLVKWKSYMGGDDFKSLVPLAKTEKPQ